MSGENTIRTDGDQTLRHLIEPQNCEEFMEYIHDREHHAHGHGHGHDHCHGHVPKAAWRLITMIVLNALVFLAELITGYITKSLALQSDAWHMLSDEASLIVGLIAHQLGKRMPTKEMTFGWARMEVLGGLVNATFLLAVCLMLFFDAIERFIDPPKIEQPLLFLIVGGIGLLANIIGMVMFHDHSHSDNIRGIFLHVMGDFFGSIGVIVTALVYYFSDWKYKMYIDPCFSILILIILCYGTVPLFKRTAMTCAERCPVSIDSEEVRGDLLSIKGLVAVHELHIWELSKDKYLSMIHIVVDTKEHHGTVLANVHNVMLGFGVFSTTVQIEFLEDFPEGVDNHGSCFYASSFGKGKRVFITPPVYRHSIGCPHLNIPGEECSSDDEDEHHHHCHGHDHDHDHHHHHDHGKKKDKKAHDLSEHHEQVDPEAVPSAI